MNRVRISVLSALLSSAAAPAWAGIGASVNYTFFSQDENTIHSPEFGLEYTTGAYALGVQWGFATNDLSYDIGTREITRSETIFFNPYITAIHALDLKLLTLKLGVGATIPVSDPDIDGSPVRFGALNSAIHGGYNLFMYAPQTFAFTGIAAAELSLGLLEVSADITPYGLISTGNKSRLADGFGFQGGAQAIFPIFPFLGAGLRVQTSVLPEEYTGGDAVEPVVAVKPFINLDFINVHAHAGLWLNVSDAFGFSFEEGGVYGVEFGLGLSF